MKIALAQINSLMAQPEQNQRKISQWIIEAKKHKTDLIVFPELALSAYSPLDLLNNQILLKKTKKALHNIHQTMPKEILALVGSPSGPPTKNSVFLLKKDQKPKIFSKEILADFNIFDEKRFFQSGKLKSNYFSFQKKYIQLLICEELWQPKKAFKLLQNRPAPSLIISVNASPFSINKQQRRIEQAKQWIKKFHCHFVYVNLCGGQEELIFDGSSFALDVNGEIIYQCSSFKEELVYLNLFPSKPKAKLPKIINKQKIIQEALIFGIKDFVRKNGFKKVHLGLSGGMDSAVVAWLSCQAVGNKNVQLFFLPGPFTSSLSEKGAKQIAKLLHCSLTKQSISESYKFFLNLDLLKKTSSLVKENLQARIRNLLLMAYANQHQDSLLLGTSNKSELAMGYGTLYGDISGGLLPIGDLLKTEIYDLAKSIKQPAIPDFILERKPSAELKKNQFDEDDLPPYKILDAALKKLIEEKSSNNMTASNKKIWEQILYSEFKRKQSPPILKIKEHSFDRGWRIPLSMKSVKL